MELFLALFCALRVFAVTPGELGWDGNLVENEE